MESSSIHQGQGVCPLLGFVIATAALLCLPAMGFCEDRDVWGPEASVVRATISAIQDQPTETTFEFRRSIWKRTDTLEITNTQGDVAYYVEENHNVFDGRTGEPRPLEGKLRERDGHTWVFLELDQTVTFWRFRGESMARIRSKRGEHGWAETHAAWREGKTVLASLSFNAEGRLVSSNVRPLGNEPGLHLDFDPFAYWGITAAAVRDRARGHLTRREDGMYHAERDFDIARDLMAYEESGSGHANLMLRKIEVEADDVEEKEDFRYLGRQRFGGLGLPTSVEIDRISKGGKAIEEIRITGIEMKTIGESDFAEIRGGLAARID